MADRPQQPRHPMIDLPLGGGEPPENEAGAPAGDSSSRAEERRPTKSGRAPRRGGGWRWLALALLLALAVAAGWFLRPDPALLVVSPTVVGFGEVRVGSATGARSLRVENHGGRQVVVGSVTLDPTSDPDFAVEAQACDGRTLAPGDGCEVELAFEPLREGERLARLGVEADAPNGPWSVAVTGRGTAPRLEADQEVLDFGPSPLGSTAPAAALTLSNQGSAPLALRDLVVDGAAAADFERRGDRCTGETLEPGTACTLQVSFTPGAAGMRRAVLRVRGDLPGPPLLVELTGLGLSAEAVADLGSEAIDFGEVVVASRSAPRRVRVTNRGDAPMAVARVGVADGAQGFEVVGGDCTDQAVAPGGACSVEVSFRPLAKGVAATVLEVEGATRGAGLRIPLAGVGVEPRLELKPSAAEFDSVRVGTSSERRLEARNAGTGTLRLAPAQVVGEGFRAASRTCPPLASGASCELRVLFEPRVAGTSRGRLELRSAAGGGVQVAVLTGTGVQPRLEIETDSLDLGTVERPGGSSARFGLASTGTAPVRITQVTVVGSGAQDFQVAESCTGSLEPGARCDLTVAFEPTEDGLRTAVLAIVHDGGPAPTEVRLVGRGRPPAVPRAEVSPARLDLGELRVGERSAIRTVTLTNAGTGPLRFSSPILEGPDAGPFYVVPGSCEGAPFLAPGAQCTFGVRFVPAEPGAVRARLVIRHEADGGRSEVTLVGVGRPVVPPPPPGGG